MISIEGQYIHKSCSKSRSRKRDTMLFKNQDLKIKASLIKRWKTPFDTTMVVDGHLMPIRVNKKNRKLLTYRTNIKKPSNNPLSKKNKALWSKRETDWFKYERR